MQLTNKPQRVWINQPSALQQYHKWHGKVGFVYPQVGTVGIARIYFYEGDLVSMRIHTSALDKC